MVCQSALLTERCPFTIDSTGEAPAKLFGSKIACIELRFEAKYVDNNHMHKMISSRLLHGAYCLTLSLAILLSTHGCAHYRVTVPDSDPVGDYEGDKMHAFFWGLYNKPEVLAADCEGEGIDNARIKSNFLYNLVSVVTLGIWMPIEVRYQCKAPPADAGEFPDDDTDKTLDLP